MKLNEFIFAFLFFLLITALFFYKVFLFHEIPFPGDLLTTIAPYKTESFLGYNPSAYPNKAQGPDVIYEIYPWRYFSISEMKRGTIPFWNPHNFSGNPQMQNYQTAVFYPLNILYFILPFSIAWTLIIFSQPLLAALFMYLFLRSYQFRKGASGIGAIAFAFSSYMTVWLEYGNIDSTILWLPLVLLLIKQFIECKSKTRFLLLTLSLFVSFLAGYIQGVFYIYIIAISYFLFYLFTRKNSNKKKFFLPGVLVFILPILFSAFQLVPTFILFSQSTRSSYNLSQIRTILQPLYYWVTIFVPDFFGNPATRNYWLPMTYIERVMYPGVPVIFFALYSLRSIKKEILFFLIVALVFLLLTTNIPGVAYIYLLPIPVISTTVATRALSIFIFSVIVLAAFGIDTWLISNKREKFIVPILFASMYILLWLSVFLIQKIHPELANNLSITKHNLIIPTGLAIATILLFVAKKFQRVTIVLLMCLVVFDLLYSFLKITPFSPEQLLYPKTPVMSYIQSHTGINRFWGYGSAYIPPNFQSIDGTYSPEGNDPLHLKNYGLLLASTNTGSYPNYVPRPDANIAAGYGATDLKTNTARQKILNLLGVKYVLNLDNTLNTTLRADETTFPPDIYKLVWQQKPWQIYENRKALPRYFLANQFVVSKTTHDTLAKMYSSFDLSKTIILTQHPSLSIDRNATGNVSLLTYTPDDVTFMTKTTGNMLLFLSDNYYQYWESTIDSKKMPIYQADMTFRAVAIPGGTHTIHMYYDIKAFVYGLYLAGIGLVVLVVYMFYCFHYEKKQTR